MSIFNEVNINIYNFYVFLVIFIFLCLKNLVKNEFKKKEKEFFNNHKKIEKTKLFLFLHI